ncbi:MAG TPA: ribonuclease P protein component [bacterium]|nr:ribonuclease P protein component [bacterium]HNS34102.1 ribonuclease P protein component [bacterium]HNZ73291.1 ribonuclease P protein component [bacterium]HOH67219.1 ribonuclease P protein component [bacterium]
MLPYKFRLTKEKDYNLVFKNGKKLSNNYFRVCFLKNNLGHSRFGIIVSNKVSKKAVVRNLLKRRIRGVLSDNLSNFSQNLDIVINLSPVVKKDLPFNDLSAGLLALLNKII